MYCLLLKSGNHNLTHITNSGRIDCNFYDLHKIPFQAQKFGKTISLKWKFQPHSPPKVAIRLQGTTLTLSLFLLQLRLRKLLSQIMQLNCSTKKIKNGSFPLILVHLIHLIHSSLSKIDGVLVTVSLGTLPMAKCPDRISQGSPHTKDTPSKLIRGAISFLDLSFHSAGSSPVGLWQPHQGLSNRDFSASNFIGITWYHNCPSSAWSIWQTSASCNFYLFNAVVITEVR